MVMTPLKTEAGWIVYVNRGFVPTAKADPSTRAGGQVTGGTTVTGRFRAPARRSWFMPGDDAAKNQWFSRDPALYAAPQGLLPASVAPYIIDAAADPSLPGGLPQGGETVVSFPNSHLGYAITWFGLAAALAGVYGVCVWRRRGG
jgi:surfeit locus 1 family protein